MISSKIGGIVGWVLAVGLGLAADASKGPDLGQLAKQYRQAQDMANTEARKRDQLALEAQSAIIRLKDAELQMERAVGAGREACGRLGKVLATGTEWQCEAPPLIPKEQKK